MDILLEVLKWIIIVLLAGFIGQFGKTMSLHIMDYLKKRKEKRAHIKSGVTNESQGVPIESSGTGEKKVEVILPPKDEKKALKAQLKARKKAEKQKN